MSKQSVRRGRWAVLAAALAAAGCGGGEFEVKISRLANERPDVTEIPAAKPELKLPGEQAFNLVSFNSSQTGAATGRATAEGGGTAEAKAEAKGGGSASGDFQLGYMFDNETKGRVHATLRLKMEMGEIIRQSGNDPETKASAALAFVVKDSNGVTLQTEPLSSSATPRGPHEWSGTQEIVLETDFEPDVGYYLVLLGHVDAKGGPGKQAESALQVRRCELTVRWSAEQGRAGATTASATPPS